MMRGILRRTVHNDSGMTLVEVVVASTIMFIILTAVLGLVAQTTLMSVQAKQKNVVTSAVNAYVERVVSLPFDQVDLVGTGDGILSAVETRTAGEFTIVIRPTVTAGANAYLKDLVLQVEVTGPGVPYQSFTSRVVIRDRSQTMTQAVQNPATDPTVDFTSVTPPDDTVVWDANWANGALIIGGEGTATSGRTIAEASLRLGDDAGSLLLEDTYEPPNEALWYPSLETWMLSGFTWNTRQSQQVLQGDGTYRTEYMVPDGRRTVVLAVRDSEDIGARATRYFVVDNYPPLAPASLSPAVVTAKRFTATWPTAQDGTDPAHGYELEIRRERRTQSPTTQPFTDWRNVGSYSGPDTTYTFNDATNDSADPQDAFRRYMIRARAVSPRGLTSDWVAAGPLVTRPLTTGTYAVVKKATGSQSSRYWRVTANLSVTPPAFPTSGTTTYTFYRVSGTTPTQIQSGTATTCTDVVEVNVNPSSSNFPVRSYYVVVRYTPSGYLGGTTLEGRSNTVSTTYREAGTYTFDEGAW